MIILFENDSFLNSLSEKGMYSKQRQEFELIIKASFPFFKAALTVAAHAVAKHAFLLLSHGYFKIYHLIGQWLSWSCH